MSNVPAAVSAMMASYRHSGRFLSLLKWFEGRVQRRGTAERAVESGYGGEDNVGMVTAVTSLNLIFHTDAFR